MTAAGNSQPFQGVAATYQPAFFQFSFQSTIYAVATHVDFSVAAGNGTLGAPTIPAKPGETIILWGTGFGPTTPAAPVGVEVPPTGFVDGQQRDGDHRRAAGGRIGCGAITGSRRVIPDRGDSSGGAGQRRLSDRRDH